MCIQACGMTRKQSKKGTFERLDRRMESDEVPAIVGEMGLLYKKQ